MKEETIEQEISKVESLFYANLNIFKTAGKQYMKLRDLIFKFENGRLDRKIYKPTPAEYDELEKGYIASYNSDPLFNRLETIKFRLTAEQMTEDFR